MQDDVDTSRKQNGEHVVALHRFSIIQINNREFSAQWCRGAIANSGVIARKCAVGSLGIYSFHFARARVRNARLAIGLQ